MISRQSLANSCRTAFQAITEGMCELGTTILHFAFSNCFFNFNLEEKNKTIITRKPISLIA